MSPFSLQRLAKHPVVQFRVWYRAALGRKDLVRPDGMCLSTVGEGGFPDGRMVLLKQADERGFVFYTDGRSPKGRSLHVYKKAALTFYWGELGRQVRVQGPVEQVSDEEADAYFATRPRLSQLGARASFQSRPLPNRAELVGRVARLAVKYIGRPVPRPSYWTGFRVQPRRVEFWQERPNRLHDRFLYTRKGSGWTITRLSP